jgi:hypothetical protein
MGSHLPRNYITEKGDQVSPIMKTTNNLILTMKTISQKIRMAGLLVLLLSIISVELDAQPAVKIRTRKYIHRTSVVLMYAHNQLKKGQNYTGDLAKAVAHQRYARKLFVTGNFQRAIYHSRRARLLAFASVEANKGSVNREWEFNKEEASATQAAAIPADQELDQALMADNPALTFDDRALVSQELKDIDADAK